MSIKHRRGSISIDIEYAYDDKQEKNQARKALSKFVKKRKIIHYNTTK